MTIQSLQKIIRLENDLYESEQVEQEKISIWLQEQQAEILRNHRAQLVALDKRKIEVKERSVTDAKIKAGEILKEARKKADYLNNLDESILIHHLETILTNIVGHEP